MSNIDGSGIIGSFNQSHSASKLAQADKSRGQQAIEGRAREARRRFEVAREEILQTETLHGSRVEADDHHEDPRGGPRRKRPKPLPAVAEEQGRESAANEASGNSGDDSSGDRGNLIDIRA